MAAGQPWHRTLAARFRIEEAGVFLAKLVPYRRCVLHTSATVAQLVEALGAHVRPLRGYRDFLGPLPTFWGDVHPGGFRLARASYFINSFRPVAYGRFVSGPAGTEVHVRFMPHPIVLGFVAFWISIPSMFAAAVVASMAAEGDASGWPLAAVLGGMGLAGYGFTMLGFGLTLRAARGPLERIIAGAGDVSAAAGPSAPRPSADGRRPVPPPS